MLKKGEGLIRSGVILPTMGDSQLMCKCGSRVFMVGVTPRIEDGNQRANLNELLCTQCKHTIGVRVDGLLQTDGEYGKESVCYNESDEYKSTWSDMT